MKSKKQDTVPKQESVGSWAKSIGIVALVAAFVAGSLDLFVVSPGATSVPVAAYLVVIGTGVGLQFVGSAIPNMKFRTRKGKTPPAPERYRIDS